MESIEGQSEGDDHRATETLTTEIEQKGAQNAVRGCVAAGHRNS